MEKIERGEHAFMKKKIVQKIMAAVISIATISSTPGLTGAVKTTTTPWAENKKRGTEGRKIQGKLGEEGKIKKLRELPENLKKSVT